MAPAADDAGAAVTADARTSAFFLPSGPLGCLLVHGFTGTPQEMRFLGDQLHARGHSVRGVQLAGHAAPPEELERCRWQDWYDSTRAGLTALQSHTPRVVVVGLSMGALLATKLAVEHPQVVRGVVLLSPAFRLSNPWLRRLGAALPLLSLLRPSQRFARKHGRDIADPVARAQSPSTPRVPLRALHQLLVLQRHAGRLLPHLQQPVLLIHSRQDHTCPVENVGFVERALPRRAQSMLLDESYHVITIDRDRERVAAAVAAFVEQTMGESS